jgi:gamma-glutamyltranspeptidase/glutathione hydrolase
LNILEHFDLHQLLRDDPAAAYHVIAEAMKLAFADRAHWVGDADFSKVPRGLTAKEYARQLAQRIDLQRAIEVPSHGLPTAWQTNVYGKHTTHIAAADADGNWVAITATVNTSFGSKVVVPGTGIVLNNEMDDFSAQPGVPNAFGLVGAEANAVAPHKRPLSSMSPTIVLKDGVPVMSAGAAGGPKIISQVVLCIINFLDGGMPIERSVEQARLHHQWRPDQLFVETTFDAHDTDLLARKGHQVEFLTAAGITQAIALRADGSFVGVSDARVPGKAQGF